MTMMETADVEMNVAMNNGLSEQERQQGHDEGGSGSRTSKMQRGWRDATMDKRQSRNVEEQDQPYERSELNT